MDTYHSHKKVLPYTGLIPFEQAIGKVSKIAKAALRDAGFTFNNNICRRHVG